jgi:hypothetical protein
VVFSEIVHIATVATYGLIGSGSLEQQALVNVVLGGRSADDTFRSMLGVHRLALQIRGGGDAALLADLEALELDWRAINAERNFFAHAAWFIDGWGVDGSALAIKSGFPRRRDPRPSTTRFPTHVQVAGVTARARALMVDLVRTTKSVSAIWTAGALRQAAP